MKEYITVTLLTYRMMASDNDKTTITEIINKNAQNGWRLVDTICPSNSGIIYGVFERDKQ